LAENLSVEYVGSQLKSTIADIQSSEFPYKVGLELLFTLQENLFQVLVKYHQIIDFSCRNFRLKAEQNNYFEDKSKVAELCEELKSISSKIQTIITQIYQHLEISASDATDKEAGFSNMTCLSSHPEIQFAYNSILSKFQSLGPSRTVKLLSFTDSLAYINNIASELVDVCEKISAVIHENTDNPFDSEDILVTSLIQSETKKHLLTRSLFFTAMHIHHIDPFIFLGSMKNRGIPFSFMQHAKNICPLFFLSLSMVFWDTVKAFSSHRNRVLPKLDNILSSWGALIFEANTLDIEVRLSMEIKDEKQQWFVYYILILTSLLMDQQLNLMLEYGLLAISEYDSFFHYCDYVCTYRTIYIEKLRELHFIVEKSIFMDALETETQRIRDSKLQTLYKGKKTVKAMKELNSADGNIQVEAMQNLKKEGIAPPNASKPTLVETYLRARSHLCRGLVIMLTSYTNISAIKRLESSHMSLNTRFIHRYRAFQGIPNPSMLKYDEVIKPVAEGENRLDPIELLGKANQCFQVAKRLVHDLREGIATTAEEKYCQSASTAMLKVNKAY
jgi:uncharacterized protein YutD